MSLTCCNLKSAIKIISPEKLSDGWKTSTTVWEKSSIWEVERNELQLCLWLYWCYNCYPPLSLSAWLKYLLTWRELAAPADTNLCSGVAVSQYGNVQMREICLQDNAVAKATGGICYSNDPVEPGHHLAGLVCLGLATTVHQSEVPVKCPQVYRITWELLTAILLHRHSTVNTHN